MGSVRRGCLHGVLRRFSGRRHRSRERPSPGSGPAAARSSSGRTSRAPVRFRGRRGLTR